MKKIDYDHSIVSLASSVLKHFGAEAKHSTLKEMDVLLAKGYENVVVMLFDGMGTAILKKHEEQSPFLCSHIRGVLSSVFPPTTVAATTSIETGLTPLEHGWLGWTLYFDEIDKNVCVFLNTEYGTDEQAATFNVAKSYIPHLTLEDEISKAGNAKAYFISRYANIKIDSVQEICENVKNLCAQKGKKYIYTYWNQPDHDMHDYGTTDAHVAEQIKFIDESVQSLCKDLKNTLVVVIADHGLVDVRWVSLLDYPHICECLTRVPSIECRALSFFVKDGMKDSFKERFEREFGNDFMLLTHEEVLESGIFGSGVPHGRFDDFVGDFLAIATGDLCIEPFALDEHPFVGMHAGLCDDELNIPFIVIEKP